MTIRAELRHERDDGTVVSTQPALSAEVTRAFDEQARATVRLVRDDWSPIGSALSPRTDRLFVVIDGTDEFGGRFDDIDRASGTVSVRLNSPEIDAKTAEPTTDNLTYENVDPETIVTETINAVPTLSLGRVDLSASAVSYTVSHGSRSKVLYDLRSQIGAEFQYKSDFSVDVVNRLGRDRDITLAPSAQNIGEDFTKRVDERESVTHVIGLGGQAGPNQLRREAVAPSYDGGRKIYRRYENKEIIDGGRLQDIIDELVREYDGEPRSVTVETTVYDEPLTLGDRVAVDYPEQDISRQLRVVRLIEQFTAEGRATRATLSNRSLTREPREQKRNDDLQRFNRGYGGFVDRDNFRAVERQPVGASLAATGEYPFPDDVVRKETAQLTVRSLPYRAYVSGAGHTHDIQIGTTTSLNDAVDVDDSAQLTLTLTSGGSSWSDGATFSENATVPSSWEGYPVFVVLRVIGAAPTDTNAPVAGDAVSFSFNSSSLLTAGIESSEHHQFTPSDGIFGDNLNVYAYRTATDITPGQNFAAFLRNISGKTLNIDTAEVTLVNMRHNHTIDIGTETSTSAAGFEPGVVESFPNSSGANADDELLASNVDVVIDGTTVASNIGSGAFTETLDISGALSPGVNDIEIQSDSLGLVSAYVETELFRRGRTTS